ncbi:MAG: helix-turn-helix domain-containing protein [Sedimentisphaerales bacterium]|nr:helix-turn-helix domain-containing protein [Sedimentisphaerales bacterium]
MNKTFIEKLMSEDEGRKLYSREDLIFEITETICKVMEEKGISKAKLSRMAGVSKSNITQLLSGDHNMCLTTVSDLLYALDSKLTVSAVPLDIDSIKESITFNQWAPVVDKTIKQSEYREINENEQKELCQAA